MNSNIIYEPQLSRRPGNRWKEGEGWLPLQSLGSGEADLAEVYWSRLFCVQADVKVLKAAMQSQGAIPFFSTNDIVLAIAWMLFCDARGLQRPGQGPSGSRR